MTLNKSLRMMSLFLFLVFSFSLVANAQSYEQNRQRDERGRGRWSYLGQSHVDGQRDHDNIRVNSNQRFRSILLEVRGGAIEFQRVVVHFENGDDTNVEIRDSIQANGRTRAIDLPGDQRRIRSVEIWYGKGNWARRSRPTLRLYGQR